MWQHNKPPPHQRQVADLYMFIFTLQLRSCWLSNIRFLVLWLSFRALTVWVIQLLEWIRWKINAPATNRNIGVGWITLFALQYLTDITVCLQHRKKTSAVHCCGLFSAQPPPATDQLQVSDSVMEFRDNWMFCEAVQIELVRRAEDCCPTLLMLVRC